VPQGPAYRRACAELLRAAANDLPVLDPAEFGLTPADALAARAEIARDLTRQASVIDPPRRFASA
jgi:hypothetical protein